VYLPEDHYDKTPPVNAPWTACFCDKHQIH